MSRIAYRRVLPVAHLALYIALVAWSCPYRDTWMHRAERWISHRAKTSSEFDLAWTCGEPSLGEQLAGGINAPAVYVSTLVNWAAFPKWKDGASTELATHTVALVLIPVFWFLIGRRLDGAAGPAKIPLWLRRFTAWTLLSVSGLMSALLCVSLVRGSWAMLVGRVLVLVWAVAGIAYASRVLRSRVAVVESPQT